MWADTSGTPVSVYSESLRTTQLSNAGHTSQASYSDSLRVSPDAPDRLSGLEDRIAAPATLEKSFQDDAIVAPRGYSTSTSISPEQTCSQRDLLV
jgi:hypothetical protein